jgi:hypothetical protein
VTHNAAQAPTMETQKEDELLNLCIKMNSTPPDRETMPFFAPRKGVLDCAAYS